MTGDGISGRSSPPRACWTAALLLAMLALPIGAGGQGPGQDADRNAPLHKMLRSPDAATASRAGRIVADIGPDAIPLLRELLTDSSWEVRRRCVRLLGEIAAPEAVAAIRASLADPAWAVRRDAVVAIGRHAGEDAFVDLGRLLSDPVWAVRIAALRAIEALAPDGVADALDPVARTDPDPDVRAAAIDALVKLRSPRAIPHLAERFRTCDPEQRPELVDSLWDLELEHALSLYRQALQSADRPVRVLAASRLLRAGHASMLGDLGAALDDFLATIVTAYDPASAIQAAWRGLGAAGEPAIRAILALLDDPGRAGDATNMQDRLLERLAVNLGADAPRELERLISDPDRSPVHAAAAKLLGTLGSPSSVKPLMALATLEDPALGRFLALLAVSSEAPPPARIAAIRALGERDSPESLPALLRALAQADDPMADREARLLEAVTALCRLGRAEGVTYAVDAGVRALIRAESQVGPHPWDRSLVHALRLPDEALAVRAISEALDRARSAGSVWVLGEDTLYRIAEQARFAHRPRLAALFYRLVLRTAPGFSLSDFRAAVELARILEAAGQYGQAASLYEQASRIGRSEGYSLEKRNPHDGIDTAARLRALPVLLRGIRTIQADDPLGGARQIKSALALGESDAWLQIHAARYLIELGSDLDLALVAARASNRLSPENPETLETLAEAHFLVGDRATAIQIYRAMVHLPYLPAVQAADYFFRCAEILQMEGNRTRHGKRFGAP